MSKRSHTYSRRWHPPRPPRCECGRILSKTLQGIKTPRAVRLQRPWAGRCLLCSAVFRKPDCSDKVEIGRRRHGEVTAGEATDTEERYVLSDGHNHAVIRWRAENHFGGAQGVIILSRPPEPSACAAVFRLNIKAFSFKTIAVSEELIICLSLSLSFHLFIHLSIINPFIYLSTYPSIYLSVYLFVCLFV